MGFVFFPEISICEERSSLFTTHVVIDDCSIWRHIKQSMFLSNCCQLDMEHSKKGEFLQGHHHFFSCAYVILVLPIKMSSSTAFQSLLNSECILLAQANNSNCTSICKKILAVWQMYGRIDVVVIEGSIFPWHSIWRVWTVFKINIYVEWPMQLPDIEGRCVLRLQNLHQIKRCLLLWELLYARKTYRISHKSSFT